VNKHLTLGEVTTKLLAQQIPFLLVLFEKKIFTSKAILVAERSKAWVCSRSFAGIAGSNPAGEMDIFLL
jgi:hypothetical protein